MGDYDYTAGQALPEEAISAENFVIGGSGAVEHDANKTEAENSTHDLAPGDYLLKVLGFGKVEPKAKTKYLNGQPVQYSAYQVALRLGDASDTSGQVWVYFTLPPEDPTFLRYYNLGGNAKGSPQSIGWEAKVFDHFVSRLLGDDKAYTFVGGKKCLSDYAKQLSNWKAKLIWAQVEMSKQEIDPITQEPKCNPSTGEPYPIRPQIRGFSYRAFIEGEGSPYGKKETRKEPERVGAARPLGIGQPPKPVTNGVAASGLSNI